MTHKPEALTQLNMLIFSLSKFSNFASIRNHFGKPEVIKWILQNFMYVLIFNI